VAPSTILPVGRPLYAWTDLTYLLHKNNVSWAYYSQKGNQVLDKDEGATPVIWNPLPLFTDVRLDNQLGNIQDVSQFFQAAAAGTLPAVSWVTPSSKESEHAPNLITDGQAWVTSVVNAVMQSPDWQSSVIFLAWDDWGGYYDHVPPPTIDGNGYGLRVPGLVISPWAKRGLIDHQTLSFDAYLKFIEDDFLGGQRLDPRTDGRPDPRPSVRENASQLGDLVNDFDFSQTPLAPLLLPLRPNSPTANAGGPYTVVAGQSLTLNASASFDLDGDPLTFSWDVNGNGVYGDAVGVQPTLTWSQLTALGIQAGHAYNVTVQAQEPNGYNSISEETILTVQSQALTTAALLQTPPSSAAIMFNETSSDGSVGVRSALAQTPEASASTHDLNGGRVEGGGWRVKGENASPLFTLHSPLSTLHPTKVRARQPVPTGDDSMQGAALEGMLDESTPALILTHLSGSQEADAIVVSRGRALDAAMKTGTIPALPDPKNDQGASETGFDLSPTAAVRTRHPGTRGVYDDEFWLAFMVDSSALAGEPRGLEMRRQSTGSGHGT
jgi:hypothetical protein